MAFKNTSNGFIDYRYYKPKFHYSKKIALKFEVDQGNSMITFSCGICADEDNFSRKVARSITDGRMKQGDVYSGGYNRELTILENIKQIAIVIVSGDDSNQEPTRLLKQLVDAFEEIEIAKVIDESGMFEIQDFVT